MIDISIDPRSAIHATCLSPRWGCQTAEWKCKMTLTHQGLRPWLIQPGPGGPGACLRESSGQSNRAV